MSDIPEAGVALAARGRLSDLAPALLDALIDRAPADGHGSGGSRPARDGALGGEARPDTADDTADGTSDDTAATVNSILRDVCLRGDEALRELARRFDGVELEALEVPPGAWDGALGALAEPVAAALRRAAANILAFHRAQLPTDVTVETEPGVRVTRRWAPLAVAGVYAPGGTAAYPSSVLMGVVAARAAGVREVVVCSPPGDDGLPSPAVMAACAVAGATRLFAVGGAGAVAAMAFGTGTVPRCDVVVGPGNRWVTEAKRQVAGRVLIDAPAGPSEVLVLADDTTDPVLAAHELLAQAEHDPDAACVLVSTSAGVADAAERALADLLASTPRNAVAARALEARGAVLVASDPEELVAFAETYAPEHLSVLTAHPGRVADRVTTAGTTFVGPWASVAYGDYMTGANHVLPTLGLSRSFSGLSTQDFLRSYTVQEVSEAGALALAPDVALLAEAEGLPAHRDAALARLPNTERRS